MKPKARKARKPATASVVFHDGTIGPIEMTSLEEVELLARAVAHKLGASVFIVAAKASPTGEQILYRYGWNGGLAAVALGALVRELATHAISSTPTVSPEVTGVCGGVPERPIGI
jgi:hypothetical protein